MPVWAAWSGPWAVVPIILAVATGVWFVSTALMAAAQALEARRSPGGRRIAWYYDGPHPHEAREVVRQLAERQAHLRPLGAGYTG